MQKNNIQNNMKNIESELHYWTKIALRKLVLLDNARFISNGKVNSQNNNVAVTKIFLYNTL